MKKVLIVDDDVGIVEVLKLIVEDGGFRVETIYKADETIKEAIIFQPDLILLDVLISGIDGRDICKELKTETQTKDIPVIMISAHPGAAQSVKNCGADDFIAKPFDLDQLLGKIKQHM